MESLLGVIRRHRPDQVIRLKQQQLAGVSDQLKETALTQLQARRHRLQKIENVLRVLGPQATLERGYSITTTLEGELVSSVIQIVPGMRILTHLGDGKIKSEVE